MGPGGEFFNEEENYSNLQYNGELNLKYFFGNRTILHLGIGCSYWESDNPIFLDNKNLTTYWNGEVEYFLTQNVSTFVRGGNNFSRGEQDGGGLPFNFSNDIITNNLGLGFRFFIREK